MLIILSWKAYFENVRVERAEDDQAEKATGYVDALPADFTAFVLPTGCPTFTDQLADRSGSFLVDLYNALVSDENSRVKKFQDKDTGLRRIGLKLIELARQAPVLSLEAKPTEEKKMPDTNRGRKRRFTDDQVITLKSEKNPKREGTAAFDRFALYRNGMTVQAALAAGVTRGDLAYDTDHEYIVVAAPTAAAA